MSFVHIGLLVLVAMPGTLWAADSIAPLASNSLRSYGIMGATEQNAVAQQLGSGFGARYQRGQNLPRRLLVADFLNLFNGGKGAKLDLVRRAREPDAAK